MKATPATSMLVLMLSLASHPVLADEGIKDLVSDETLAAYCATVPLDSETTATLTALDGSTVTGTVECEKDDLVAAPNDDDQQGTDEQGNLEDDDSDDDREGDGDSGDASDDGGDDSGDDDSGDDNGHDDGGDD